MNSKNIKRDSGLFIILALILSLGELGCAPAREGRKSVIKECILPQDQLGTLSGRWPVYPIPVAFKNGQFSSSELNDLTGAAGIWNEFYEASLGIQILDTGGGGANLSNASKPASICSQGILQGSQFSGHVVVYKHGTWPYSNRNIVALTTFCPISASPLPRFHMAIMEVNYQDFFVTGKKLPDLKSIFVHEFGHLVGLNHSCSTTSQTGFPNCNHSSISQAYFSAVMFPVVLFDSLGFGEKRTELNENDQGRANCLYQDLVR